ncbi:hypothetical protein EZH22_05645 [Xanthobacter dioxanivorans]|uniref:Uncharacterized protein n=1 Tax=Xanthobacter dioxanivorans TaxID=2528964 RepID=A0A974PQG7_9HYPH|nr:hypothetical protein [Xanthobacter dioxanivorans]QRG07858.1 hypothetical protein EZH22_05645 [Xanthobacter dioxanivorans]
MPESGRYVVTALTRQVAALKTQLAELQEALAPKEAAIGRAAADAREWVSDHAKALPFLDLGRRRAVHSGYARPAAVAAAALVVGLGVGCVLYAVASARRRRPAFAASKGGARRPSPGV